MDAERLLRMLGATGKLKGFYQAVYMIEQVKQEWDDNTIYNILGQRFDQDPTQLPQGIYIQNGKKFIKQ